MRTLNLPETQLLRRGHDFYVVPDETPKVYATDGTTPLDERIIWAHFFGPNQHWWLAEVDDDGYAFGYVDLSLGPGCDEWGPFSLVELEGLSVFGGLVIIERDLDWKPKPFRECRSDDHRSTH